MSKWTIYLPSGEVTATSSLDFWALNAKTLDLMNIKDSGPVLTEDHAALIVSEICEAIARRGAVNTGKTRKVRIK